MAAPVNKMLVGMEAFFLSKTGVTQRIARRLTRGVSHIRIVAHEQPESQVASKQQEFAEYELSTGEKGLLLNGKSRFNMAVVDFRFFARFIQEAAGLYDAFYDVIVAEDADGRFSGTWGAETTNSTVIQGARWDDSTARDDRDAQIGMAYMEVSLVVPFVG